MKKNIIWVLVIVVVMGGLIFWSIKSGQKKQQGFLGEAIAIQGRDHIEIGAYHPVYNSNPPTSGWHYVVEANWGVSEKELPDEQVIHNLEHGGIWISYKDIDNTTKIELEKIAQYDSKIVVSPRSKNDAKIAVASWGRLQKLDSFNEATIINFIKANKNNAPEPDAQ